MSQENVLEQVDKNNAQAVRQLAFVGVDVCNRLKESLNQTGFRQDHPEDWVATARRNFERLIHTALTAEQK